MLRDVGFLISRLVLGASIAAHGAQKEWGAFDGPGPQGTAMFMSSLGFVPGERYAVAAARTEITSGVLIALGLGGPLGPAALVSTMIVAQTSVHAKNGYFAQANGIELGVMYVTATLAIASAGYGRYSCDEAFGWHKLREPAVTALALVGGVAAGLVILAQRSSPEGSNPALSPDEHQPPSTVSDPAGASRVVAGEETVG